VPLPRPLRRRRAADLRRRPDRRWA
jgi:hypothetical protein